MTRRWWEPSAGDSSDAGAASSAKVHALARRLAEEDNLAEVVSRGWLPPCKVVSPLGGGGYSREEYAMMERDRGKYLLYAAAVRSAVSDLLKASVVPAPAMTSAADGILPSPPSSSSLSSSSSSSSSSLSSTTPPLRVLVLGCGRGRLVQFVLDAVAAVEVAAGSAETVDEGGAGQSTTSGPSKEHREIPRGLRRHRRRRRRVEVVAVDANPIAIAHCRRRFAAYSPNDATNVDAGSTSANYDAGEPAEDQSEHGEDDDVSRDDAAALVAVRVVGPCALLPGATLEELPEALQRFGGCTDLAVSELLGSFADVCAFELVALVRSFIRSFVRSPSASFSLSLLTHALVSFRPQFLAFLFLVFDGHHPARTSS
jgi:hypothetical protein